MAAGVPFVELAGQGDALGVRRPNGEAHAARAVHFHHVRSQDFVAFEERAFAVQVEVRLGDLRAVAVRVVDFNLASVPQAQAKRVGARRSVQGRAEEPLGVLPLHFVAGGAGDDRGGFRLRQERTHLPAVLPAFLPDAVRAEDAKRVPMISANNGLYFLGAHV